MKNTAGGSVRRALTCFVPETKLADRHWVPELPLCILLAEEENIFISSLIIIYWVRQLRQSLFMSLSLVM